MKQQEASTIPMEDLAQSKIPFNWKLHRLLEEAEQQSFDHIVSWLPDGTSFIIRDADAFCTNIMPLYFNQTKFKSFTRQVCGNALPLI